LFLNDSKCSHARAPRSKEELTVRKNDWFELNLGFGSIAVLAREHVDLPLIHSKLADIGL
jgi:hypothetical protein